MAHLSYFFATTIPGTVRDSPQLNPGAQKNGRGKGGMGWRKKRSSWIISHFSCVVLLLLCCILSQNKICLCVGLCCHEVMQRILFFTKKNLHFFLLPGWRQMEMSDIKAKAKKEILLPEMRKKRRRFNKSGMKIKICCLLHLLLIKQCVWLLS